MIAFNFYDDKYGFETCQTAPSARMVAETVHFSSWRAVRREEAAALLLPSDPWGHLQPRLDGPRDQEGEERRILESIDGILSAGSLEPGMAGKLKGKLMFGASQL